MQTPVSGSKAERYARDFSEYLATGREARDMGVGTGAGGGYTVAPSFLAQVLFGLAYTSGILARIRTWDSPNGAPATLPTVLDTAGVAVAQTENTLISETDSTIGRVVFGTTPNIVTGLMRAGIGLVADLRAVRVDFDAMLANQWAFKLARYLDSLAVTALLAGLTTTFTTAGAGALVYNDLIELIFSTNLAARGSPSSALVVSPTTAKAILEMKDSQNRPLVLNQNYEIAVEDNSIGGGTITRNVSVPTIAGFPVLESVAFATFAAGNNVGVFADFNQAAILRMPVGAMSIQKLNERYADYGEVGWLGFARADVQVADPLAGAILKIHA
jgi:HK97 family phage major capsid protein